MALDTEFENKLFMMADKLRNNIDAAEYKHVVLGLVFLKYISDAFEEKYLELLKEGEGFEEDEDEYIACNIFFVPQESRWDYIKQNAKKPSIGKIIDDAMEAIEEKNGSLKGVLPKNYARPELDKTKLGELIDLFSFKIGDKGSKDKDILGRVYEFFLAKFASQEGKLGGEFYTPTPVVQLLVEILKPYKGRIFDPCCGSGGMFVQSEKFIKAHQGSIEDISVYGQEFNPTTWRLCKMNLAIRGIDGNLGTKNADSFGDDLFSTLKADYILANPPFNISDWGGEKLRTDYRWKYGVPPVKNANFAWVQHIISHLSPQGKAGFVLGNGAMVSDDESEAEIRKNIIEADLLECVIALPDQMFYSTDIPACLWFINRNKTIHEKGKVLFIDARKMYRNIDRNHKEFTEEQIKQIANIYENYKNGEKYFDIKGFCKSATLNDIRYHQYYIAPGRYVEVENEISLNSIQNVVNDLKSICINDPIDKKINLSKFKYGCSIFEEYFINLEWMKKIDYNSTTNELPKGWKIVKLSDLIQQYSVKNKSNLDYPVLSVTKDSKFVPSDEQFNKQVYSADLTGYRVLHRDYFAFNPARINIGSIAFLDEYDHGLVSPAYTVFKCTDGVNPLFVWYLINSYRVFELIKNFCTGTVRQVFKYSDFSYIKICLPPKELIDRFSSKLEAVSKMIKQLQMDTVNGLVNYIESTGDSNE